MTYWKAVRPDGTDFHTGRVQWTPPAGHVGEWVVCHPTSSEVGSHPAAHLSVSTVPTDCTGMEWPCRLLEVEALGEVTSPDPDLPNKRAGRAFRVLREVPATEALGPQGEYVASLISSIRGVTRAAAGRVALAWSPTLDGIWEDDWYKAWSATFAGPRNAAIDATWDATRDAAWNAMRESAWAATWVASLRAMRGAALDATRALLTRDLITTEDYDALTRPWRTAIGSIHPDDPAL